MRLILDMFIIILLEKLKWVKLSVGLLEMIINAPFPVVLMVLITMFINEHSVIMASHMSSIPKQPPLSEVERKFDHVQPFNLSFVVVGGKSTRSLKIWLLYTVDCDKIAKDGDKK